MPLTPAAIHPLTTLDPTAPLTDLDWLDAVVGGARVVALGESSHYNHEFNLLRHRLLRYLVERHGFTDYATESGHTDGRVVDAWVRGGPGTVAEAQAHGITSLFGPWTETRDLLTWLRRHNATASNPVGFCGLDVPGSQASLLAGLDPVLDYLARADPEFTPDAGLRAAVAEYAAESSFSMPRVMKTYAGLPAATRDAVTAGLSDLHTRLIALRFDYIGRTDAAAYATALRDLTNTVALDAMLREVARGSGTPIHFSIRERAIADTATQLIDRGGRILVTAHNAHVQRGPFAIPAVGRGSTLGMHLAERLGDDYVTIATTSATGEVLAMGEDFYAGRLFEELPPPEPDSLDGVLAAGAEGRFGLDLRALPEPDAALLAAVKRQRIGTMYLDLDPSACFDAIIHIPHVTAAEPDAEALAHSPAEVREVFEKYRARQTGDPAE